MSGWTEERIDILRRGVAEGLSYGQISKQLNAGLSRNACIGKARRIGIAHTPEVAKFNRVQGDNMTVRKPALPPKPARVKVWSGNTIAAAPDVPLPALREVKTDTPPRHWLTRKFGECAWPVDGEGADVRSCCAITDGKAPYCGPHAKLAFAPGRGEWAKKGSELVRSLRKYA